MIDRLKLSDRGGASVVGCSDNRSILPGGPKNRSCGEKGEGCAEHWKETNLLKNRKIQKILRTNNTPIKVKLIENLNEKESLKIEEIYIKLIILG